MKVEILGSGGALTTPRPGCEPMGMCEFQPLTGEPRLHEGEFGYEGMLLDP
jgi:hypothetical protein